MFGVSQVSPLSLVLPSFQEQEHERKVRIGARTLTPEQNKLLDEVLDTELIWKPKTSPFLPQGKCFPTLKGISPRSIGEFIAKKIGSLPLVYGGTVFKVVTLDRSFFCSDIDLRFIQTSRNYYLSQSLYLTYLKLRIIQCLKQEKDTFMVEDSVEIIDQYFRKIFEQEICSELDSGQIDDLLLNSYSCGKSFFPDAERHPRACLIRSLNFDLEFIAKSDLRRFKRDVFREEGLVIEVAQGASMFKYDNGSNIVPEGVDEAIESIKNGELSIENPEKVNGVLLAYIARRFSQRFSILKSVEVCQIALKSLKSYSPKQASDHLLHQVQLRYSRLPYAQIAYYLNLFYCFVHSSMYSQEYVEECIKQWKQLLEKEKEPKQGLIVLSMLLLKHPKLFSELVTLIPGLLLLSKGQNEHVQICVRNQVGDFLTSTVHHISITVEGYSYHFAIDPPAHLAIKFIRAWNILANQLTHQVFVDLLQNLAVDFRLKAVDFPKKEYSSEQFIEQFFESLSQEIPIPDVNGLKPLQLHSFSSMMFIESILKEELFSKTLESRASILSFALQKTVEKLKKLQLIELAGSINSLSNYLKNSKKFKRDGVQAAKVFLQDFPKESSPLLINWITQGCEILLNQEMHSLTKHSLVGYLSAFSKPHSILRIYPEKQRNPWLRQFLDAFTKALNAFVTAEELLEIFDDFAKLISQKGYSEEVEERLHSLKSAISDKLLKAVNKIVLQKKSGLISSVSYECFFRAMQGTSSADSLTKTWSTFLKQAPSLETRLIWLRIAEQFAQRKERNCIQTAVRTVIPILANLTSPLQKEEIGSLKALLLALGQSSERIEKLLKLLSQEKFFAEAIALLQEIAIQLDPKSAQSLIFRYKLSTSERAVKQDVDRKVFASAQAQEELDSIQSVAPSISPIISLKKLAEQIVHAKKEGVEQLQRACNKFLESLLKQTEEFLQKKNCKQLISHTLSQLIDQSNSLEQAFYLLKILTERKLLDLQKRLEFWIPLLNAYQKHKISPTPELLQLGLQELLLAKQSKCVGSIEDMAVPLAQMINCERERLKDFNLLEIFIHRTLSQKTFKNPEAWLNELLKLIVASDDPQYIGIIKQLFAPFPAFEQRICTACAKYLLGIIHLELQEKDKVKKTKEALKYIENKLKEKITSPELNELVRLCKIGLLAYYGSSEQDVINALDHIEHVNNPTFAFLEILPLLNRSFIFRENSEIELSLISALAFLNVSKLRIPLNEISVYSELFFQFFKKASLSNSVHFFPFIIFRSLVLEVRKCNEKLLKVRNPKYEEQHKKISEQLSSLTQALLKIKPTLTDSSIKIFSESVERYQSLKQLHFLVRKFNMLYKTHLTKDPKPALHLCKKVYTQIMTVLMTKKDEASEKENIHLNIDHLAYFLNHGILFNADVECDQKEMFVEIQKDWHKQMQQHIGILANLLIPFLRLLRSELKDNSELNLNTAMREYESILIALELNKLQKEDAGKKWISLSVISEIIGVLNLLESSQKEKVSSTKMNRPLVEKVIEFAYLYGKATGEKVEKILDADSSLTAVVKQGKDILIAHQSFMHKMGLLLPLFNMINDVLESRRSRLSPNASISF